jgi:hypothetical protein
MAVAAIAEQEWARLFAAGPDASIAQRCYQDALHEMYAFLSLKELLPAAHSCRAWYAAAGKEKKRGLTWQQRIECNAFQQLCISPLRRHVIGVDGGFLSSRDLQQLALQLPHLQSLRVSLQESALQPLMSNVAARHTFMQCGFSAHLCCLVLQMTSSVEVCQVVLNTLPTAFALTHLKLSLVMKWSRQLVLAPLLQLSRLTDLSLSIDSAAPTRAHLAIIKQIQSLRRLDLDRGRWRRNARLLASLCAPPHALMQLHEIDLRHTVVNEAVLTECARLPSLGKLEPLCLLPCAFPLLPRLSQLCVLSVRLNRGLFNGAAATPTYPTAAEQNALCVALAVCRQLSELSIKACNNADLLSSFLPLLLRSTSALRCLRLNTVNVCSLAFLGAAPQLTELFLQECWPRLPAVEVMGIRMPLLQTLHLIHAAILDDVQWAQLCPPSTLLPSLRACRYH